MNSAFVSVDDAFFFNIFAGACSSILGEYCGCGLGDGDGGTGVRQLSMAISMEMPAHIYSRNQL